MYRIYSEAGYMHNTHFSDWVLCIRQPELLEVSKCLENASTPEIPGAGTTVTWTADYCSSFQAEWGSQ